MDNIDILNNTSIKKQMKTDVDLLAGVIAGIETHNAIAFEYHKDPAFVGTRKVQPHNLYWNKDNSKLLCDAVQIEGDSKSGIKSFKQFNTEHMKDCIVLDDKFIIHKQYNATSDRYNNSVLGIIE